jgi:hypothetical protein
VVDPRAVEYVRANRGQYAPEALKAALLKGGISDADADEAIRLAALPPPMPMPVAAAPAPAPAALPPEPAPAQPPPASGPAPAGFSLEAVFATARSVVLEPTAFYRTMPRDGGWNEPMLFLLSMAAASAVVHFVAHAVLHFGRGGALGVVAGGFMVLFSLFLIPLTVAFGSVLVHVLWLVLGSKQSLETSFRCVAYSAALMPVQALAQSLPFVGAVAGIAVFLYSAYLFVPASVEVHGLSRPKVLVAAAFLAGIPLMIALVLGVVAWKASRLMRGGGADRALAMALMSAAAQKPGGPAPASGLGLIGVPPVDPDALKALLPAAIPGFTRTSIQTFRQAVAAGALISARGLYAAADGGRLKIDLVDSAGLPGVLPAARVSSYDPVKRGGSLQFVQGGRFLVSVSGQGVDSAALEAAASAVDVAALEALPSRSVVPK